MNKEKQWNLEAKFVLESMTILKEEWGFDKLMYAINKPQLQNIF